MDSYKLKTTRIDEELEREKQEEVRLFEKEGKKMKGDMSMPNINTFVTEANEKESRMFPKLNKSKFLIDKSKKNKEKENKQDSRDFTMIIRKYNEYKHDNDMLVEKIEEAKRLEGKMSSRNLDLEAISASIEDLSLKKSQI